MRFFLGLLICFFVLTPAFAQDAIVTPNAVQPIAPSAAPDTASDAISPQVMEAFIEEAKVFQHYCSIKPNFRRYYDCECLAARFLDERITLGEEAQRGSIMMRIQGTCKDASEASAKQFRSCLGNSLLLPSDIDPEVYCTCYANVFAKSFESRPGSLSPSALTKSQTYAHLQCRETGYAEENYGDAAR